MLRTCVRLRTLRFMRLTAVIPQLLSVLLQPFLLLRLPLRIIKALAKLLELLLQLQDSTLDIHLVSNTGRRGGHCDVVPLGTVVMRCVYDVLRLSGLTRWTTQGIFRPLFLRRLLFDMDRGQVKSRGADTASFERDVRRSGGAMRVGGWIVMGGRP
jgi:hypothetical protein